MEIFTAVVIVITILYVIFSIISTWITKKKVTIAPIDLFYTMLMAVYVAIYYTEYGVGIIPTIMFVLIAIFECLLNMEYDKRK